MAVDLSVVITCHGRCPELDAAIAAFSVQEQYDTVRDRGYVPVGPSRCGLEIVVTSDGPYEGNAAHLRKENVRLVTNPKEGGVGHHTRGPGIAAASGDWVVLTNADNLYCAAFTDTVKVAMRPGVGLIYWDCCNSLWKYTTNGGSRLQRAGIDLGCVAVRSDIAKRIGFPYRNYDGDWDYIEACRNLVCQAGLGVQQIKQTLYFHN